MKTKYNLGDVISFRDSDYVNGEMVTVDVTGPINEIVINDNGVIYSIQNEKLRTCFEDDIK